MTRGPLSHLTCAAIVASAPVLLGDDWPQWGRGPQHTGASPVVAQPLEAILANVVYDPFVDQEKAASGDDLLVHYPVPLLEGNAVYLGTKSGVYQGADSWGTQTWGVRKLEWRNGVLTEAWSVTTDWKPVPNGSRLGGWEPVFHPVLTGEFLWMPGAFGSLLQVAKDTGRITARIVPFQTGALNIFVAGGLAADGAGNVYYGALQLAPSQPWDTDSLGGWLVKVSPSGNATIAPFSNLVPGAPAAGDLCAASFSSEPLPWPPSSGAVAARLPCGSERPAINAIPAIAPNGTIYTVSRAHLNDRYGYLVAVGPDLTPRWSASLRGLLNDGCDILLPPSGTPGGCRAGSARGVDPETNDRPAARVLDQSSSSPVVLPDGSVLYGAFTRYNYDRGHLFRFAADGRPLASYDFGWDITPAVFSHGATYSILTKDNHYDVGSYCNDPAFCPVPAPRYDVTQLDPQLRPEWHVTNTTAENCRRGAGGQVTCVAAPPGGFEWCVNQPAVDASGVVYLNSEDGFVYAIGPGGVVRERLFLDQALGAAYTPLSIGGDGLVYAQNNGHLFVVGRGAR